MRLLYWICVFAVIATVYGQAPSFSNSYHVVANMQLPYASINEKMEVWYDGVNNHQRTELYSGLDTYIYRPDLQLTWQINPVINAKQCFRSNGTTALNPMFPDLSTFTLVGTSTINGRLCDDWQSVNTVGEKTNTYDFYVDSSSAAPVRYQMFGYDTLLGSHYDQYILDYITYEPMTFTNGDGHFEHPVLNCGDFPGPGASMNPMDEVTMHFPAAKSTLPDVSAEYNQFMTKYGKSYKSQQETAQRQNLFTHNKKYIDYTNYRAEKRGQSMRLAINHMADMNEVEMQRMRGIRGAASKAQQHYAPLRVHKSDKVNQDQLPGNVDWRTKGAVNTVQDQGICGSCWSFGTAAVMEGQYFMTFGQLVKFSEQELMDCSWPYGNNACDGGEDYRAYQWIATNNGLSLTSDYGSYLMADGWCHANTTKKTGIIDGYVSINTGDVIALMDSIANNGPMSVAIDASHKSLSFYSSGVYYEPECGNGPNDLDHAVLAVGYGTSADNEPYWIIKNSWSTHYGNQGYMLMSRKDNNCGVATQATYPVLNKMRSAKP